MKPVLPRVIAACLAVSAVLCAPRAGLAQAPANGDMDLSGSFRLIVAFVRGGGNDIIACCLIGLKLQESLGHNCRWGKFGSAPADACQRSMSRLQAGGRLHAAHRCGAVQWLIGPAVVEKVPHATRRDFSCSFH